MAPSLNTRSTSLSSRTRRQRQSKGSSSSMLILDNGKGTTRQGPQNKKRSIDSSEHENVNASVNAHVNTNVNEDDGPFSSSSPRSSMVELEHFDNHGHKSNSDPPGCNINANTSTNAYLEKIRQKREQNQMRLDELGLGELKSSMAKKNKKQKRSTSATNTDNTNTKRKTRNTTASTAPVPVRRSSRKGTKPTKYTGDEEELMHETELRLRSLNERENNKSGIVTIVDDNDDVNGKRTNTKNNSARPKKIKMRQYNLVDQISTEKRAVYQNIPHEEWVKDMERFCHMKLQNSDTNVQRVMKIVEKLVVGRGVQHPSTGAWFKKGIKVNLSNDFRSMLDEAAQWVYDNGGDRGHGWLIEHPVKKCFVYQQARAENGGAFYSETKP